jgi:quercetin dioxygenase-like cupin family protein
MQSPFCAFLATSALLCTSLSAASDERDSHASVVERSQLAIKRTVLRRADVPGTNYEVVYALVEIAAHSIVPRHTHPGTVFGYLMSGDYTILISGSPHSIRTGERWEVPAGVVHEERTCAGGAKILAVFTVEKGKPLTSIVD